MSTTDSSNKLYHGNTKHKTKSDELYKNWFDSLIKQIDRMENVEGFIKDNHIRKHKLKSHIMYKVNFGTSSKPICQLKQKGKNYEYEFVVEFDTETPQYGIYYGCRAIINQPNDHDQHIHTNNPYQPSQQITDEVLNSAINDINKDWIGIKTKIQEILKNVFPDKKWSDMAFRPTNNASDDTYWAFWVAVGDDDDIVEVVARATLLIANAYSLHFCSTPLFNPISFKTYYSKEIKPKLNYIKLL